MFDIKKITDQYGVDNVRIQYVTEKDDEPANDHTAMYTITERKWSMSENHKIELKPLLSDGNNQLLYITDFNQLYRYTDRNIITVFVRKEPGAEFVELTIEDSSEYEPDLLDVMDDRN